MKSPTELCAPLTIEGVRLTARLAELVREIDAAEGVLPPDTDDPDYWGMRWIRERGED